MQLNNFEEASYQLDISISKNPKNSQYYYNKANVLQKLNCFEEALKYFEYAIQINPDNPEYYSEKAMLLI